MLKIQFTDNRQQPFWVMEKSFSVGRANKNHLTIADTSVSEQHARIQNQGETFLLKDLGSEQGTFVNGQRITQKNIVCGDTISFGAVSLEIVDPLDESDDDNYWSLIADSSWLSGQEFPILGQADDVVSVGRSATCDIVFPGTHLSRLHAEITIHYAYLMIRDMGSANGTFVNDKKITSAQLFPGDKVRLDVYSFRVFGPGIKLPKSSTTAIQAIPDPAEYESKSNGTKKWKARPTSPGNREEIDLYTNKHRKQLLLAGAVIAGVAAAFAYVLMGVLSV